MTWTTDRPTVSGWYWYKEAGLNYDKPMPTWVFDTGGLFYASRMAPHELANIATTQRLTSCPGKWWGPVEVPD